MSKNCASVELSSLAARRDEAQRRVDELERELHAAGQAREDARAALVEAERRGIGAAERMKLEKALADAEARPTILLARVEGSRAAVRDAEVEMRKYVAENLSELVCELEADGDRAVSDLNDALESVVAAYHRREGIAARIMSLAAMVGPLRPGDVSRSKAEDVVRAASALLAGSGEVRPELLHDPREPRHAEAAAPAA